MRKLHPATIIVALLPRLREAIQASIPLLIGSFASGHSGNHDWIAIFIGGFTGIFSVGTYLTTRFEILPDHVSYKTGWIFRKDRRIPIEQIQNVNIRQNLLERIFKVATVNVETAMGHKRDLNLSVLGLADAERLREELLGAAHVETGVAPLVHEPILRLNNHDLLLGAVTENHLMQMVLWTVTIGGPTLGAIITFADKLPEYAAAGVFCGAAVLFLIGTWLWGAIAYYLKYGGFAVYSNDSLFRISYGLLNKVQMAIRPGRIELLRLTTTLPQRYIGRSNLHVGTASTFGEAGVLAPVALMVRQDVAYRGASDIFSGLRIAELAWQPFDSIFYVASVIRSVIGMAVFGAIYEYVSLSFEGAPVVVCRTIFVVIATVILMRLAALFLAKPENGFAITDDFIVVRQGYIHQLVSAMPIERMENVAAIQPMWWMKRSSIRVTVQAMKHRIHIGAMPESAIEVLLSQWKAKAELRENRVALSSELEVTERFAQDLEGADTSRF